MLCVCYQNTESSGQKAFPRKRLSETSEQHIPLDCTKYGSPEGRPIHTGFAG